MCVMDYLRPSHLINIFSSYFFFDIPTLAKVKWLDKCLKLQIPLMATSLVKQTIKTSHLKLFIRLMKKTLNLFRNFT